METHAPRLEQEPASNIDQPIINNPDPLLTVKEVAYFLRLKPGTVRAMARRGELPALKIGRVWRFRRAALSDLFHEEE